MFLILCSLSVVYLYRPYMFLSREGDGCSGMRHARFTISAAFLAWGGHAINVCCTHHICGVSRCWGCRVEPVPGFDFDCLCRNNTTYSLHHCRPSDRIWRWCGSNVQYNIYSHCADF